ncbi:MAG: hypothetical protein QXD29_00775 [Thermoplasmata archaeon]
MRYRKLLTIAINDTIEKHLKKLQEETGDSISEIVRTAIETFYILTRPRTSFIYILRNIKEIADDIGEEVDISEQ